MAKRRGRNNPWAICHASTGPKKTAKFERCVKKVKEHITEEDQKRKPIKIRSIRLKPKKLRVTKKPIKIKKVLTIKNIIGTDPITGIRRWLMPPKTDEGQIESILKLVIDKLEEGRGRGADRRQTSKRYRRGASKKKINKKRRLRLSDRDDRAAAEERDRRDQKNRQEAQDQEDEGEI